MTLAIALTAAIITVGQLTFAIAKEWRAARRIVAVAGVNDRMVAEYGCVPVQFAGSPSRLVELLVSVWGFFWVGPTTPKHPFWARRVVGIRDGREIDYESVRVGDGLRVVLESNEHPDSLVKSLRRGSAGGYRTIAVRNIEEPEVRERAYCVTIRTRGRFAPAVPDGTEPLWLQFDAVNAAPRSRCRNGPAPLDEVPDDAVELLLAPSVAYRRAASVTNPKPNRIKHRLLRHNANPWAALAHLTVRRAIVVLVGFAIPAILLDWHATWSLFAAGCVVGIVAVELLASFYFISAAVKRMMRSSEPADSLEWLRYLHYVQTTEAEWFPTTRVNTTPPSIWAGSTSHGMSVGRRLDHTAAKSIIRHQWHRIAPWFRQFRWNFYRFSRFLGALRDLRRTRRGATQ